MCDILIVFYFTYVLGMQE